MVNEKLLSLSQPPYYSLTSNGLLYLEGQPPYFSLTSNILLYSEGQPSYYSLTSNILLYLDGQPPYYSLASPAYESMGPSHMAHHSDPLGKDIIEGIIFY